VLAKRSCLKLNQMKQSSTNSFDKLAERVTPRCYSVSHTLEKEICTCSNRRALFAKVYSAGVLSTTTSRPRALLPQLLLEAHHARRGVRFTHAPPSSLPRATTKKQKPRVGIGEVDHKALLGHHFPVCWNVRKKDGNI
jgi:hypothetical protein